MRQDPGGKERRRPMIPTIVLVSIGGGFGAAARFLVDGAVQKANGTGVPLGTAVVNATGSFLVGLVSSAVSAGLVGDEAASFATIGILGGGGTRRSRPLASKRSACCEAACGGLRFSISAGSLPCRPAACWPGSQREGRFSREYGSLDAGWTGPPEMRGLGSQPRKTTSSLADFRRLIWFPMPGTMACGAGWHRLGGRVGCFGRFARADPGPPAFRVFSR